MSLWFIIWFLLCGTLLYFFGWTNLILYKQKKSWKHYASKKGLRYRSENMLSAPEISGSIDGYSITLFTGEHQVSDGRTSRKLTALEVDMHSTFPMQGVVASGGMVAHVENFLDYRNDLKPEVDGWKKSYLVRTDNRAAMEKYLTEPRLKALLSLMSVKNAWFILIFQKDTTLLRLDTPYPFEDPAKIDKMIKKVLKAGKAMELGPGEVNDLMAAKSISESQSTLDVSDEALSDSSFELEEGEEDKQATED